MLQRSDGMPELVREGVLDAELAALCWLLVEDNVPFVVTGDADLAGRLRVRGALMRLPPAGDRTTFDTDRYVPTVADLGEVLQQGERVAIVTPGADLRSAIEHLTGPAVGLPDEAVRRLGLVLVVDVVPSVAPGPIQDRVRVVAAHYLRPIERDAQGHIQRRPPAVLATWDPVADAFDHFAWGVMGELADRVDRSQASFEELQATRAAAIGALAADPQTAPSLEDVLDAEPPRVPAPPRAVAVPSPLQSPLTDPPAHGH